MDGSKNGEDSFFLRLKLVVDSLTYKLGFPPGEPAAFVGKRVDDY